MRRFTFILGIIFIFFLNFEIMGQGLQKANTNSQDTIVVKGQFVKHQFYNKGGRLIEGAFDVFFKTENDEIFVKNFHCGFPEGELKNNFDALFEVKLVKTFGLWDADDNNVQSRVGDYVEIFEINKLK